MKGLTCRVSLAVIAVFSATFASKPCQALNGGYTVQITLDATPIVMDFAGARGKQKFALYTAKLFNGTHEVPALQECGKPIVWDWDTIYVTHIDEKGDKYIDLDNPIRLDKNQNKAQVVLPTASRAHYGYYWATRFAAGASQDSTDCHPQGWDQAADAELELDDTIKPLPPGGGVIASVPPLV